MIEEVNRSILVVDGSETLPGYTARILRFEGYSIFQVPTGEAAIKLMETTPFDVVIADLSLSGQVNGFEVLAYHYRLYRKGGRILTTASNFSQLVRICEYLGTVYLPKPVQLNELLFNIRLLSVVK